MKIAFMTAAVASFCAANCNADLVYGVKTFGTGTIDSAPPARLFCFQAGDAVVTNIGTIVEGTNQIDVDGLAYNVNVGLFGFRLSGGNSSLVSIDGSSAQANAVGATLAGRSIRGASFDRDGNLWAVDVNQSEMFRVDTATGAIVGTPVSIQSGVTQAIDIAVNQNGEFWLIDDQTFSLLDPLTGQVQSLHVDSDPGADGFQLANVGMAFNPLADGSIFTLDVAEDDDVFHYDSLDNFSRSLSFADIYLGFNSGRGDLASSISAIPEPSSGALIVFLCGLALNRLGRRKR